MEKWIKNEWPWLQMPSDTRGNATNAPVGLTRGWARFLQAPTHTKITMKVALGGEVCFPCKNKSLVQANVDLRIWVTWQFSSPWHPLMIPVTLEKTRCNVVSVLVHENWDCNEDFGFLFSFLLINEYKQEIFLAICIISIPICWDELFLGVAFFTNHK